MERLEAKQVNGGTYYYYSQWAKVDGKCRRVWQKYLGKLEDIVQAVQGGGPSPRYAEVFQWGLPQVLWSECCRAEIIAHVDQQCPKRSQGMSIGQYLAIAALSDHEVTEAMDDKQAPGFIPGELHLPPNSTVSLPPGPLPARLAGAQG